MSAAPAAYCPICAAAPQTERDREGPLARGGFGVRFAKRGILLGFARIHV